MSKPYQGIARRGRPMRRLLVAAVAAAMSAGAYAGETIEFDNGVKVDWTATAGYTAAWRMKDPSSQLSGAANAAGDDGDLNFKKNAVINNRVSLLAEANIQKDKSGFFIRASSFYDDVYHHSNDNPGGTLNTFQPANQFTEDARYYSGGRTRLLDSYGYTTLDLGDASTLNLRLGRHVVSWGEAYYFSTLASAQAPTDVSKALIPGTEVKDFLLPVNQLSASLAVNNDWSLMAYTQFESNKSELPPVGSYFWGTDLMGPGATCVSSIMNIPGLGKICPFGARTGDERAKKDGQWGIGTRYRFTQVDEIGLYYFNYHDRTGLPVFTVTNSGVFSQNPLTFAANYRVKYFEDIKTTGITYSTRVGEWQLSAEASYKDGMPVLVNTGGFTTPTRAKVTQYTLSTVKLFGANPISDGASLVLELSGSNIGGIKAATLEATGTAAAEAAFLQASMPAYCSPLGTCGSYAELNASNSKSAAAYAVNLVLNYNGVFPGWDLDVPISWMQGLHGANATTMAGLTSHADKRLNLGLNFKYLGKLQVGLNYVAYLGSAKPGGPDAVSYADRNFLSATVKYSF